MTSRLRLNGVDGSTVRASQCPALSPPRARVISLVIVGPTVALK